MKRRLNKPAKKLDISKEVRNWGIVLIIVGLLHFILSNFLDFTWGIVLIIVGIIALFYRSRKMLLVFGILLIFVGIMNIFSSMFTLSGFWTFFGCLQIYWGIKEIIFFSSTKKFKN